MKAKRQFVRCYSLPATARAKSAALIRVSHRMALMLLLLLNCVARRVWHPFVVLLATTTLAVVADALARTRAASDVSDSLPRLEIQYQHADAISAVAVSRDGRIAATADPEGWIVLRNMSTGRQIRRLRAGFSVLQLAFSVDETRLLALGGNLGQEKLQAEIWDVRRGTLVQSIPTALSGITFGSYRFADFVHDQQSTNNIVMCDSTQHWSAIVVLAIRCELRSLPDSPYPEDQTTTNYRQFSVPGDSLVERIVDVTRIGQTLYVLAIGLTRKSIIALRLNLDNPDDNAFVDHTISHDKIVESAKLVGKQAICAVDETREVLCWKLQTSRTSSRPITVTQVPARPPSVITIAGLSDGKLVVARRTDGFDSAASDDEESVRPHGTVDVMIGDPFVPGVEQWMSIAIASPLSSSLQYKYFSEGRGLQAWRANDARRSLLVESSTSGDRIAIASYGGFAVVDRPEKSATTYNLDYPIRPESLAFSEDGSQLALLGERNSHWNVRTGIHAGVSESLYGTYIGDTFLLAPIQNPIPSTGLFPHLQSFSPKKGLSQISLPTQSCGPRQLAIHHTMIGLQEGSVNLTSDALQTDFWEALCRSVVASLSPTDLQSENWWISAIWRDRIAISSLGADENRVRNQIRNIVDGSQYWSREVKNRFPFSDLLNHDLEAAVWDYTSVFPTFFNGLSFSADGSRAIVRSFPSEDTVRIELVHAQTGKTVHLWEIQWDASVGFADQHQTLLESEHPYPSSTLAPVISNDGVVALVTQGFDLTRNETNDPGSRIDKIVEVLSLENGRKLKRFTVEPGVHILTGYANTENTAWVLLGIDTIRKGWTLTFWDTRDVATVPLDVVPRIPADKWASFSPDGSLLGVIEAEGSVRLWRVQESGTIMPLARLIGFANGDWTVVKEDGRYDASRPADVGPLSWITHSDPLDPLALSAFYLDFYEPALLTRLLSGEVLPQINAIEKRDRAVPKVKISKIVASNDTEAVDVEVQVERRSAAAIGDVRLFRDGSLIGTSRIEELDGSGRPEYTAAFRNIALPSNWSQAVEFSAYAFNGDGVKSETSFGYIGADHVNARERRAFIVSIGVNAHENASWDLQYAADDARAVSELLEEKLRRSGHFDAVYPVTLVSQRGQGSTVEGNARREDLLNVLDALGGKKVPPGSGSLIPGFHQLSKATPDDFVFLSFSGHGVNGEDGLFHFVLSDTGPGVARRVDRHFLGRTLDSNLLATKMLRLDAGGIAMSIDACNSANSIQGTGFKPGPMGSRGLGQLSYDKRMMVIAASQAESVAVESDALRHGLLTFAMLREGLQGGLADSDPNDGLVSLREMMAYGVRRVPELHEHILRDSFVPKGLDSVSEVFVGSLEGHHRELQRPQLFPFSEIRVLMPIK